MSDVTLVHFSDLHLDAQFSWMGIASQGARDRRQALRDALRRITALVQQTGAAALLCGGDLYEHERVSPDTGAFLRQVFAELDPVPVYLAPGNHDWYSRQSLYHRVAWPANVHVFTSDRLEPVRLRPWLTLWGAAHRGPANAPNFLRDFKVDGGGIHLALFHGSELGGAAGEGEGNEPHAPFRAEQIAAAGLHHALLGHYHRPCDAPWYTYPGNPEPLAFGEEGERGAVVVTVAPDGGITRRRRRVAVGEVADVAVDLSGCGSRDEVRRRVLQAAGTRPRYVRVTLHGELDACVDLTLRDLAHAAAHLPGVVVRVGEVRTGYDLQAIAAEATVRGQFVRQVQAAPELSEAMKRRVLTTGLRALDGRDDLEVV